MSDKKYIGVYIGSFDPIHKGHVEAIEKTIEFCNDQGIQLSKVVISPNNPRKGKPNRTPLFYRAHLLSKLYPIFVGFDDFDYYDHNDKVIIDTDFANNILSRIKSHNLGIIGIIGSDIVKNGSQPKWQPDRWIIFEREGYCLGDEILNDNNFFGIPCDFVMLNQTKYQHISSTMIRENPESSIALELVPDILHPYILTNKRIGFYSLSEDTVSHFVEIIKDIKYFVKEMRNNTIVSDYVRKSNLWNSIEDNPFVSAKIIKVKDLQIYETLVESSGTLWDSIMENDIDILKIFVQTLNVLHEKQLLEDNEENKVIILHGDLSPTNVLVIRDKIEIKFAIIDYDNVKENQKQYLLRDYFQFWSSIDFYAKRCGIVINTKELEEIGNEHYTVLNKFESVTIQHWQNFWKLKLK